MTAWKACGPKLTNVGEHSQAVITRLDESGSDGAHKPCVSLKSSFDLVSSILLYFQSTHQSLNTENIFSNPSALIKVGAHANDLPPPTISFLFHPVPIFQLNSNLRI